MALKLKPLIAEKAKKQQGTRTDISQKSVKSLDTQKEPAHIAGVSHDTIHKIEVIEKKASPEAKQAEYHGNQYGGLSQKSVKAKRMEQTSVRNLRRV